MQTPAYENGPVLIELYVQRFLMGKQPLRFVLEIEIRLRMVIFFSDRLKLVSTELRDRIGCEKQEESRPKILKKI